MDISRYKGLIAIQHAVAAAKGNLQTVMDTIAAEYSVMPQANGIAVELRDGDQLYYAAASGASASMLGLRIELYNSLSGKSVLSGDPLVCRDSETDPRVDRASCQRVGLRSMIVVPIPHRGQVVGVLKYHAAEADAFGELDLLVAQLLVGPIAVGMSSVGEEDALQAQNELREIVKLKEELVCTVSHELRTPITAIAGSFDLLERGAAGELPEKARRLVSIGSRSAERLKLLVNDLLDVEKLGSGRMHFDLEMLDLCAVMREAVAQNEAYALQADVTLKLELPDSPVPLLTDQARLIQALTNLISNAAKFSFPETVVLVRLDRVGDCVRLRVEDRGPGIPENFRRRLFDRFAQSDETRSRSNMPGTGLGLSICKAIIEQLGGTIQLDTAYDKGAAFDIMLPLPVLQL